MTWPPQILGVEVLSAPEPLGGTALTTVGGAIADGHCTCGGWIIDAGLVSVSVQCLYLSLWVTQTGLRIL